MITSDDPFALSEEEARPHWRPSADESVDLPASTTKREYKLSGDPFVTQAGQIRSEVLEITDGHRSVILVVSNDDAVDVLEALRRAYQDGREDRSCEADRRGYQG